MVPGEPCRNCLRSHQSCPIRGPACTSCPASANWGCTFVGWGKPCRPCAAQGTACSLERFWDDIYIRAFVTTPDATLGNAWAAAVTEARTAPARGTRRAARRAQQMVEARIKALRSASLKEIEATETTDVPSKTPAASQSSLTTGQATPGGTPLPVTDAPPSELPSQPRLLARASLPSPVGPTPADNNPVNPASLPPANELRVPLHMPNPPLVTTLDQGESSDEEPIALRHPRTIPCSTPRPNKAKGTAGATLAIAIVKSDAKLPSVSARPSTSKATSLPSLSSEPEFSSLSDADDTDWESDTGSDSDYFLPSDGGSVSTATPPRRRKRRRATLVRHAASSATSASSVRAGADDADLSSPSSNRKPAKPTPRIRKTPQRVKTRQPTSAASPSGASNANANDTHSSVSSVIRSTSKVTPLKRRASRATTSQEHTPSASSAQTPKTTRRLSPEQSPWTRARPPWQDHAGTPRSTNALPSPHLQVAPDSDDDTADEREVLRILFPESPLSGARSRLSPPPGVPAR
ncbi:hypothetical protein PsYK624_137410 [Phanerochaete sordida]|uniref:Uncharacterized protein n=1 Tax=Phanerochaete sordida TaxID=48140 RepID=A0A9P3GLI5_9APHY|nr:hypothetical protein PsYK624_137410 [Phanerochaete sordida]